MLLAAELLFTSTCEGSVSMPLRTTFTGAVKNVTRAPDLDVTSLAATAPGTEAFAGTTKTAEPSCFGVWPGGSGEFTGDQRCKLGDPSTRPEIAVVYTATPASVAVTPGKRTVTFISAYGSSHNNTAAPLAQANAIYAHASRLADSVDGAGEDGLYAAHLAGMAALWDVEQGGASILASGADPRLARSAWTALHALTSSMSESWGGADLAPAHAYSPGGLYSGGVRELDLPFVGYLGHVFW
eukprot:COSAG02_NODE_595_length_19813_cov_12.215380_2_plen_241_part_00